MEVTANCATFPAGILADIFTHQTIRVLNV